ncbi:YpjP family protein [Ureibacillus composti]|nr:YpjP family protein [Ureibacillus composti]
MKKWFQKLLVITVALLTFGIITPNHEIWDLLDNGQPSDSTSSGYNEISNIEQHEVDSHVEQQTVEESVDSLLFAAKEQSYIKFGSRISPVIGEEFESRIYPKMEEAITMTLSNLDHQSIRSLIVTENPSGEYSEKIFHIKDGDKRQDLIRFHVRTENRPQEGYYYNFHYHTKEDQFLAHHHIGDIYWSKNTPPKWLS